MTEQRKKLINRFQSWLDTDPRKQIIAAVCANIAEEYAEQQLLLRNVSQQRELLLAYEKSQYETTWWMSEAEATNRINDFLANNCG